MSTQHLPSPPVSARSPSASANGESLASSNLPIPRHHPLKPGSSKEISLINYVDEKILRITRRYGKKFSNSPTDKDDAPGYTSFEQVIADIDPLLDVVWISGTTSLQVPYLLSLAGLACSYMPAFSFTTSMFRLMNKIDLAFSTLLQRQDLGPASLSASSALSTTDKVRIKSLVEETRITAVNVASQYGYSASVQDLSSDEEAETENESEIEIGKTNIHDDNIAMALSRIYKRTLEIVGDSLR